MVDALVTGSGDRKCHVFFSFIFEIRNCNFFGGGVRETKKIYVTFYIAFGVVEKNHFRGNLNTIPVTSHNTTPSVVIFFT